MVPIIVDFGVSRMVDTKMTWANRKCRLLGTRNSAK